MPLEDLDLEFEDEEEIKRRKKEAVDVDVDLEFQAPPGAQKKPAATSAAKPEAAAQSAVVKNIADAKPAQAARASAQAAPQIQSANASAPRSVGNAALKVEPHFASDDVEELKQQLQLKDAVMEYRVELLGEVLGDIKLLDHQVGQLLTRLAAKHPESKQELLMIKKLLADFTAKKRK
jgi:hypothetical protein